MIHQIRNFRKYHATNGANFVRICLFTLNALLMSHQIKLLFIDDHFHFFVGVSIVWFVMQFQDWIYPVLAKIRNRFK